MEGGREIASDFGDIESARLRSDLYTYMAPHDGGTDESLEQIREARENAEQSLIGALVDLSVNDWTAREMIAAYDDIVVERDEGRVVYAYYSLIRQMIDHYPHVPVPASLIGFVEQRANAIEEFSIVVDLGMMNIGLLSAPERTSGSIESLIDHVKHKQRELDAYVAHVSSELYRSYSESVAELAKYSGESYTIERELIDRHRHNPDRLRNVIAAGQIRTDQGMAVARLQHDCDMIARHSGSIEDQQRDVKQYLLLTHEGRVATIAQYEQGLIAQYEEHPERLKMAIRRDLQTFAAKALAAARYDQYLIDRAKGDIIAIYNDLAAGYFLSEQGRKTAEQIVPGQK